MNRKDRLRRNHGGHRHQQSPMEKMFGIVGLLCVLGLAAAQLSAAPAPTRVALVIGNGAYPPVTVDNLFGALSNPVADARDMADLLRGYGFTVDTLTEAGQRDMEAAVNRFMRQLEAGGTGLFYYSGHGVQVQQENYLIPVGRSFADAADVQEYAVKANWVLRKMELARTRVNLMILDACREDLPLEDTKGFSRKGLAEMRARGALIGYAASPGQYALGDSDSRNSLYTRHLLAAAASAALPIELVFKQAGAAVVKETGGDQIPWIGSNLVGDFCFGECGRLLSSDEAAQRTITDLLRACERHFQANRLTTGRGGTALDCYEQVLKRDPANAEALNGIDRIEAQYAAWARQKIGLKQFDKARQYLDSLHLVNPESTALADLRNALAPPTPSPPTPIPPTPRPATPMPATPTPSPTAEPTSPPTNTAPIQLRSTPRTVSDAEFITMFGLDKNRRPRDYIDNQFEARGEVVVDHVTGLMWQQSGSENRMRHQAAQQYIRQLNQQRFSGYADWRLPTIPELMSLLEPTRKHGDLYIDPLFDAIQWWCWSADLQIKGESSSESAWLVSFHRGHVYWHYFTHSGYVRAVRS